MKLNQKGLYSLYIWLIVFALIPLVLVLITSFLTTDNTRLATLPLTLQHYRTLLTPTFAHIFLRSLWIAGLTTGICLLIAYPFSYWMAQSKHQSLLLLLIMIPFWTSSLIRTYALIAILKYKGILNTFLLKWHIIHVPLALMYTNLAVIMGLVYNLFPFMVLPLYTQMERFDRNLIYAAKDLGANKWFIFTRVFLPNTREGILSGCLFVLLPAMTLFYIPAILGGSRALLLGNVIQNQLLVLNNWPQGAAISVVLTCLLGGLFAMYRNNPEGSLR